MITKSKQNWSNGSTVRVGFLTLVVICAVRTPGDGAPDAYCLRNINGTKLYRFVPHLGCSEITITEASAMQDEADRQGTTERAQLAEACRATRQFVAAGLARSALNEQARKHFAAAFQFADAQECDERWAEFSALLA